MDKVQQAASTVEPSLRSRDRAKRAHGERIVHWLIWVYFFFLLIEGALRKWVLPGFSNPLLIVRDPIVILIYIFAIHAKLFPHARLVQQMLLLAVIFFICSPLGTDFNVLTAIYGMRTNFLHLPLIFLLPRVFDREDVIRMGKAFLILMLPMTFVVANQFEGSPIDRINTTAGGTGLQIVSAGGKVRASGTFSFVNGVVYYLAFCTAFAVYGFLRKGTYSKLVLYGASICIFAGMVMSGSRSAVLGVLLVLGMIVFLYFAHPTVFGRILLFGTITSALIFTTLQIGVVQDGLDILQLRFAQAAESGASPVVDFFQRTGRNLLSPFIIGFGAPIFGHGLGLGTNAGAALAGRGPFALGEDDWVRIINEVGPILGNLYLLWRILVVVYLFQTSYRAAKSFNLVIPRSLLRGR